MDPFLPSSFVAEAWPLIEPYFARLHTRSLATAQQLEAFLLDWGELSAAISEARSRRYAAMTCNTADAAIEKEYLRFSEEIDPKASEWAQKLRECFLASPARGALGAKRYAVLDRKLQNERDLFRQENIPLQVEEVRHSQQYQKVCGALTVEWQGQERTIQQMAGAISGVERPEREKIWKLVWERRYAEREKVERIFDDLLAVRVKQAGNAGYADFQEYVFKVYERFDYTPGHCQAFHAAIESSVVPLARKIMQRHRTALGTTELRPWDIGTGRPFELMVHPPGTPAPRPFKDEAEFTAKAARVLDRVDAEFAARFRDMQRRGEFDLMNRKGKAPGAYVTTYDRVRRPFLFMNATNVADDVQTLFHEYGHAFHAIECAPEPLAPYRGCGMEFSEVASMSMELFVFNELGEFYSAEELRAARRQLLEHIVLFLPYMAQVDLFQTWIYRNPKHSAADRAAKWTELDARFGPALSWDGIEHLRGVFWHQQGHIFGAPFYYIEYGIAQLGALKLWAAHRRDAKRAIAAYRRGLALGGSKPLPKLFEAAEIKFDFSEQTVRPLLQMVDEELARVSP